jgi:uncharacterized protein (DUF2141 family)
MKVRTGVAGAAFVGVLAAAAPSLAAEDDCVGKKSAHRLSVQVSGVSPAQGEVAVTLYPDDSRRFLAPKGKLARARVKAQAPVTRACFWVPAPGVYAIAVYHDADGDRDFDRNAVGMPAEGFGFSNDAPTRIGLPAFDKVRFRARAGETILPIKMRYQR